MKMHKRKNVGKEKYLTTALIFGIFLFLCSICVTNLFHFNYKMNADIAAEAMLGELVWETKDLHPDIWFFDTEARIFGTLNFSALFNGLTKDMNLSQGLACCVMTGLLLWSVYAFGRTIGWRRNENLLFLFMGLSIPADPVILELLYIFCCYYGLHTIVLFFTLGVYARSLERKKLDLPGAAVSLLFALCLGIQGVREMLVLYGPLFGIEFVRNLYLFYCKQRPGKSERLLPVWVVSLLAVNYLGTFAPISIGHGFSRNIRKGFWKLGSVVLPEVGKAIGFDSAGPVGKLCLIVLIGILLGMLADTLWRMFKKEELKSQEWCFLAICASPVVSVLMVSFTTVDSSMRYYFMIVYAMAYAVILAVKRLHANSHRFLLPAAGLVFVMLAASNFHTVYQPIFRSVEPPRNDWYYVVHYLEENDLIRAYTTFENAGVMTVISNGEVEVAAVDSVEKMDVCKWQGRRDWYVPYVPFEERTAYIVPESRMEDFQKFLKLHEKEMTLETQIGRFYIYVSDYNFVRLDD